MLVFWKDDTTELTFLAVYNCVDLCRSWKALIRTLCYTVSPVYVAGKPPLHQSHPVHPPPATISPLL